MRPIVLKGHERPLTKVVYNQEGDLLFTTSKGKSGQVMATVWRSDTGERLGTYDGHGGTVWDCDISHDSEVFMTASADSRIRSYRAQTGDLLVGVNQGDENNLPPPPFSLFPLPIDSLMHPPFLVLMHNLT